VGRQTKFAFQLASRFASSTLTGIHPGRSCKARRIGSVLLPDLYTKYVSIAAGLAVEAEALAAFFDVDI
jgi:hypothetical protein